MAASAVRIAAVAVSASPIGAEASAHGLAAAVQPACVPLAAISAIVINASAFLDRRGMYFVLADTAQAVDALAMAVSKSLADAVTVTDVVTVSVGYARAFDDSVEVADAISRTISRDGEAGLSDGASTTDAAAIALAKSLPADSATASDAVALALAKSLADTVSTTEAVSKVIAKVLADAAAATDAVALVVSKALADAAGTSDAGSIWLQDYAGDVGASYFAADYVGQLLTTF
jgi:hypothetical protein